jgi:putative transposase
MPWQETDPMFERHHFTQDLASGPWTMTELCARYGISRNTGYKWRERFLSLGVRGLEEQSRAPLSSPNETPQETIDLILAEHSRYGWGARKILKRLQSTHPLLDLPERSTIFDILARNDRVRRRRSRTHSKHPGAAPLQTTAPNQVWTIDFKGQFRTRDGVYSYPYHFSRYPLCCQSFPDVKALGVHRALRRLFRTHGLPDAIRSDSGTPFASNGIHGLNRLNAWWLQLGIVHQRIGPARSQENGAHERMHWVLKAKVTKPAAANAKLQQRVFNTFVQTYNEVRPHEALNDETPASRWHPSARPLPTRIIPPTYPGHFEIRRVSTAGTFRLHNGQQFLTQALNGEIIGLEEVQDGVWNVIYYEPLLGRFDERTRTITGAPSLKKDC